MGLLDGNLSQDQSMALGLLGMGLMRGDFASGGGQALQHLAGAKDREQQRAMQALQMQQAQAQLAAFQQQQADAAQAREARQNVPDPAELNSSMALASGFNAGSVGPTIANAGRIQPVSPLQQMLHPLVKAGAAPLGDYLNLFKPKELPINKLNPQDFTPESLQKFALTRNYGDLVRMDKLHFADTNTSIVPLNPFTGAQVGQATPKQVQPMAVNRGNQIDYRNPYTMDLLGSFGINQSPDNAASVGATIRGQNMTDARARESNANGTIPSGYRRVAGGLEFIPGGPADPNVAKRAAPTEFQGKSTTFGARMVDAARVIDELDGKVWPSTVARAGYSAEFPSWLPGGAIVGSALTTANRAMTPEDAQRYYQAQENWVTANLRQESGAAIGKDEMAKDIRKWFPQPGDSKATIAQKAAARKVAERAMLVQSGPGVSSIPGIVGGGTAPLPGTNVDDPLGLRQ